MKSLIEVLAEVIQNEKYIADRKSDPTHVVYPLRHVTLVSLSVVQSLQERRINSM